MNSLMSLVALADALTVFTIRPVARTEAVYVAAFAIIFLLAKSIFRLVLNIWFVAGHKLPQPRVSQRMLTALSKFLYAWLTAIIGYVVSTTIVNRLIIKRFLVIKRIGRRIVFERLTWNMWLSLTSIDLVMIHYRFTCVNWRTARTWRWIHCVQACTWVRDVCTSKGSKALGRNNR